MNNSEYNYSSLLPEKFMKIFDPSGRYRKSIVLKISNDFPPDFLIGMLPAKPAHIHNPELSEKIAKSAYKPINLSLIGINPDASP